MTRIYKEQFRHNLTLAYPVILGQAGHMFTHLADNIMVGQLGHVPLAAASFGHNIFAVFMLFGIGLSLGITPITGKFYGERDTEGITATLRHGGLIYLISGILIAGGMISIIPFFHIFNQPPEVVEAASPYYLLLAYSMLPFMFFLYAKQFLEGLGKTRPPMVASLVFNLVNIGLNYLLIYGKLGFPKLGLEGAAVATIIAKSLMAAYLLVYLFTRDQFRPYTRNYFNLRFKFQLVRNILKISLPISLQFILEVGIFSAGGIMAGWFGSKALAAHQIAMTITSFTYLMASGLGTAATISVSQNLGKRDFKTLRIAANTNYMMVLVFMSLCAGFIIAGRYLIPSWYIEDQAVIQIAGTLFIIMAFYQLFDGVQVVALGALRGLHEVKIPTGIALFSYWLVAMPVAYSLSKFTALDVQGIWYGYMSGLGTAAVLLSLWFVKSRKKKARAH